MNVTGTVSVARREWRLANREPRVFSTLAVVAALTLLALFTGWSRTQQRLWQNQTIERQNEKQRRFLKSAFDEDVSAFSSESELSRADEDRRVALQMSARSPDLMRFTGGLWTTYLPANSLTGLATGASRSWPDHYRHGGLSVVQTLNRNMQPNPLLAVTGAFDMTLFVGAVLPLAVIILSFDVVAADRESGRWTLIQTQCESIVGLAAMRCLLRVAAVAFVVSVAVIAWTIVFSAGQIDLSALTRVVAFCGWLFGYLAFWGALTFLVASFRLSSTGSGLVLLFCWITLVLVVPSFVEMRINQSVAMPKPTQLASIEERVRDQVENEADSIWADYLRQHPSIELDDDDPQLEFLLRDIANQNAARSRVDEQLQVYFERFLDREGYVDRLQLLVPTLAWRTVVNQYSGNSLRHYVDFADATADFHGEYIRYFEPMTLARRELSLGEIESLPVFDGRELSKHLYRSPLLLAGLAMLIWTCICFLAGWIRFRRSEVRAGTRTSAGSA